MRKTTCSLALSVLLSWFLSSTSGADVPLLSPKSPEWDIDRFGMNLAAGIPLPTADPDLCRVRCTEHPDCSAWTYVKPGVQGSSAMCYLKAGVPVPVSNTCCVSGVYNKLSADLFVDRPGADFTSFPLPEPSLEACRRACSADPACVAYTRVAPGFQGPSAVCYLKSAVPAPVPNTCCGSGVYTALSTERDTERPGMTYRSFDLPVAEPDLCRQACAKDGTWPLAGLATPSPLGPAPPPPTHCKAYTYVNPGVHSNLARCFLKSGVPAPVTPRQCCVSGVAREVSFLTPDLGPGCPGLYTIVGSTFGTAPAYPQVLSSNEFLKSVARLKAADPARKSFDIAVFAPEDPEDGWLVTVEQSVQPTLGSDEVLVILNNFRGDGETRIRAYDGAACSFGPSISAVEGGTVQMTFNKASASTLVMSRNVCGFLCFSRSWKDVVVWSEPNFWTTFGGRRITFDWYPR